MAADPFWFLSLPPHMAWATLCGDVQVIPVDDGCLGIPPRIIMHVVPYSDEIDRDEGDEYFKGIGMSLEDVTPNSIIGWMQKKKVYQFDAERWEKDKDLHTYTKPLVVFQGATGFKEVWGVHLHEGQILVDPVFGVSAPDDEKGFSGFWSPENPFHKLVGNTAIKSVCNSVEELTA